MTTNSDDQPAVYRVYRLTGDQPVTEDILGSWAEPVDGGFEYEFETEPLFGTPTEYTGVFTVVEQFLIVGRAKGSKSDKVATRIVENTDLGLEDVELTPTEQHRLFDEYDGYATRIAHPEFSETDVSEIARLKELSQHSDIDDSDGVRAEAAENHYPVIRGDIENGDSRVTVDFRDGTCDFSRTDDCNTQTAKWIGSVVDNIAGSNSDNE